MPIWLEAISVQILTKKGHEVVFLKEGGYIKNLRNGQITKFIEREGVYFLKMFRCRNDDKPEPAGFSRQGRKN